MRVTLSSTLSIKHVSVCVCFFFICLEKERQRQREIQADHASELRGCVLQWGMDSNLILWTFSETVLRWYHHNTFYKIVLTVENSFLFYIILLTFFILWYIYIYWENSIVLGISCNFKTFIMRESEKEKERDQLVVSVIRLGQHVTSCWPSKLTAFRAAFWCKHTQSNTLHTHPHTHSALPAVCHFVIICVFSPFVCVCMYTVCVCKWYKEGCRCLYVSVQYARWSPLIHSPALKSVDGVCICVCMCTCMCTRYMFGYWDGFY